MIPTVAAGLIVALCQFVNQVFSENIKQFRFKLDDENTQLSEQERKLYERKIKKSKYCCHILNAISAVYIILVCGMCVYDLIKH